MTEVWRERALAAEAELVAVREDVTRLREALEAIVVRCEEGDRRTDWLPTIARIARAALVVSSQPGEQAAPQEASDKKPSDAGGEQP